jgi:hypothetical protein
MHASVAASLVVTVAVVSVLGHAAARDVKPIAILSAPHVALAPAAIGFHVRLQPEADDRQLWALLCDRTDDEPCTLAHHERLSQIDIEGDRAPRLWSPRAWQHVDAGDYALVAAIGPVGRIRAQTMQRVLVTAP